MRAAVESDLVQRETRFVTFGNDEAEQVEVDTTPIVRSGAGAGEREVDAEVDTLRNAGEAFINHYKDGLNAFAITMNAASDQEATPRYFDVALKSVGKSLLGNLIDHATDGMPILGPVVKGAKDLFDDVVGEAERAQEAGGDARIRDYITDTLRAITDDNGLEKRLLGTVDSARPALLAEYQAAVARNASAAPDESARAESIERQGRNRLLTGEPATFVRELKQQVEEFKNAVPSITTFQRRFTEEFADTPGRTAPISQGGLESGTLHLFMDVYRERSSPTAPWEYRIDSTQSSWGLATNAPRADRLAQSLKDTIGGNIARTRLRKFVEIRVETEVDWLPNDYDRAHITFRNPDAPSFRGNNQPLARWVWSKGPIRDAVRAVTNIEARS
ncbi:MAG: hypothetical protein AAGA42_15380 [Actinomycetota bacterium]